MRKIPDITKVYNCEHVNLNRIDALSFDEFYSQVSTLLSEEQRHCTEYFAIQSDKNLRLYCCIADDNDHKISVLSTEVDSGTASIKSLTPSSKQVHIFEREIHERFGLNFAGHPWLKPVRFAHDRADKTKVMDNYPFYTIEGEELHEVGVGPIHAGIIEPGHFRFICNGEKVLHLEIQLGYQHRGIERLFIEKNDAIQRCILAESIAGDTSVGHSLAHTQVIESLAEIQVDKSLQIERCIALELERVAVHIGDTAALCADVAYQLGQVTCEALRTLVINTTQAWCGNRFGKGLIRPGGSYYPLTDEMADQILITLTEVARRFKEMTDTLYSMPSVLSRFEGTGTVTKQQALSIGTVGLAARTCDLGRDVRSSHPFQYFKEFIIQPVILQTGDVLARGMLRNLEVFESIKIINQLIGIWRGIKKVSSRPVYNYNLKPESMVISMVEGWRGEICHTVMTDKTGKITCYKVKDPSLHNWMALALAVRNQEISDFPVCNKSFNLSYCGFDL